MTPKAIFHKILLLFRKNPHYLFAFFILLFAVFYHYFIIPPEILKSNKASADKAQTEQPDLDAKHQEKTYPRIFQSHAGDVFRIGIFASTKNAEDIEIFAESELNEVLKVGEWHLEPLANGEYRELFFSAPGRYEDITVRLKKGEEGDAAMNDDAMNKKWDDSAVSIRSLSLSRVEAKDALALQNLAPTVFGISTMKKDILLSRKSVAGEAGGQDGKDTLMEWIFQTQGDFLEAIEFSGKIVGSGRQEYVVQLMRYFPDKQEKEGKLLHSSSFILDALNDLSVSSGNYQMPFPFPLEYGKWYKVTLTKTPSKDWENSFTIGPLEANMATDTDSNGDLALLIRERLRTKNDASFPDGAKLEDLGERFFYSFSLRGTPLDFANTFDASTSIRYDAKKHLVIGSQKNKEYLIYRFDMPYPFDRFVLEAVQAGDDKKEIKLEYSFDNAFWKEIPFVQEVGDAQRFLLTLEGDGKSRTVYVRASYNGEDKKSGFFGLQTLNVNASIAKTQ